MQISTELENLCEKEAWYIIDNNATIRETAKNFGRSKSIVHRDMLAVLPECNSILAQEVRLLFKQHKQEAHIRGGMATKRKYESKKV